MTGSITVTVVVVVYITLYNYSNTMILNYTTYYICIYLPN